MGELETGAFGQVAVHLLPEVAVVADLPAPRADGDEALQLVHVGQRLFERSNPIAQLLLQRHDPLSDGDARPELLEAMGREGKLEKASAAVDVLEGKRLELSTFLGSTPWKQ